MPPRFPCSICYKNVNANHRAVFCDACKYWVHCGCNYLTKHDYDRLKKEDESINWFCLSCIKDNIPYSNLTDNEYLILQKSDVLYHNNDGCFSPHPPHIQNHLKNLNEYLNKAVSSPDADDDDDATDNDLENHSPINCNYYNFDEFSKAKFDSSKSFSILHLNIHSIQRHIESFRLFIQTIESDKFEFDILAISESKLKLDVEPIVDITLNNFHPPINTPSEANKGGVLLYINKRIDKFKPRADLKIYESRLLESAFIEIINHGKPNDIIGVIYRHPSIALDHFNDVHLRPLITKLSNEKRKNINIAGDFNVNLLNVASHPSSSEFFDILTSNFLLPSISLPTKINSSGNHTLIDNIYTNVFNPDTISGNIEFDISDGHLPSFVIFPNANQTYLPKKHNFYKNDTRNFNPNCDDFPIQKFLMSQEFNGLDWKNILQIEKLDANLSTNNFFSAIEPIISKFLPLKKVTKKDHKRKYKPWISNDIISMMEKRDKLLRKSNRLKRNTDNWTNVRNEYKIIRNKVVDLTFRSKLNFYNSYFTTNNGNLRKIWQGIKQIINIKSNNYDSPTCVYDVEGNLVTEPTAIANSFVHQYSSVADEILSKRKYEGDGDFSKFMPPSVPNSIAVDFVDVEEICSIIKKFDVRKAYGPNSIPSLVLHHMQSELSKPLSWIANICLISGIHPDKLKIAKIATIFKKGSRLQTCNYRPISLLSNINKIFEKVVYSRVFSFLNKNNSIYNLQYGFRPKYSTSHALIHITEQIREALDSGKIACGVFVDFQKAFDTVNHHILLKKLAHYGIRGTMNDWFKSYLHNRKQYVSVLGFDSEALDTKHGVPQGSVLGPLLFLIYINDLHRSIKHSSTTHFADDTHLLKIDDSIYSLQSKMNSDLKGLCCWLRANKIALNAAKTELIIFRKPQTPRPLLNIKIDGKIISPSSNIKYLGLYLDEYLNGSAHCDKLQTKLRRSNGMLAKSRHYLRQNPQNILNVYHSIFSSHMIYGCQIWGQNDSRYLKKIQVLQNNALRLVTFAGSFRDHVSPIYKHLCILKLRDFVTLQNLLMVHDFFNNKLPESFSGYFTLSSELHDHETRSADQGQLFVPSTNSTHYGRDSIKLKAILSWNHFSDIFQENLLQLTRSKFKKIITNHFLDSYNAYDLNE